MLDSAVKNAGLSGMFGPHLSMGIDAFRLKREEIGFAAFGGRDAAGAKALGYPTFWVNRLSLPVEELGVRPDAMGRNNLNDLANVVIARH